MNSSSCSSEESAAPRVAHCIAGVARSFLAVNSTYVVRGLRHNMVDAFGGRSVVFLLLKTFETAQKDVSFRFPASPAEDIVRDGTLSSEQASALRHAVRYLRAAEVRLVTEEQVTLNPACTWGSGANTSATQTYSTAAGVLRHVGQMEASLGCLEMIAAHEARHGFRFDMVVRSRPDLGVVAPMPGWCRFPDARSLYLPQQFNVDWVYVSSRAVANVTLSVVHEYRRCRGQLDGGGHFEVLLSKVAQRAGFRRVLVPMPVALVQSACAAPDGSCSSVPAYKHERTVRLIGCCVEGQLAQCHFGNALCGDVLRATHGRLDHGGRRDRDGES